MMASPVSEFLTSRGIFSPSKIFESDSVISSRRRDSWVRYSSLTFLRARRWSLGERRPSSLSVREETFTSMMIPEIPEGTRREVSFTSRAFSPKIARRSFSSGAKSPSLLGVIFPTRMSSGLTSAPMRITPSRFRLRKASSPRFGISRVICSGPSFVSRAVTSNSSMWIEVKTSSFSKRSERRIASSKL